MDLFGKVIIIVGIIALFGVVNLTYGCDNFLKYQTPNSVMMVVNHIMYQYFPLPPLT